MECWLPRVEGGRGNGELLILGNEHEVLVKQDEYFLEICYTTLYLESTIVYCTLNMRSSLLVNFKIYWSIVDSQCFNFCCTAEWLIYIYISVKYIYIYIYIYI